MAFPPLNHSNGVVFSFFFILPQIKAAPHTSPDISCLYPQTTAVSFSQRTAVFVIPHKATAVVFCYPRQLIAKEEGYDKHIYIRGDNYTALTTLKQITT